ncbi:hypothetical protein RBE51_19270 [Pseudomonas taiwanensis]|uniref:hypothetical protein n=1 Tax=Pseudomonas taiwanensis TaxID=470150 RepID=UPI0028DEF4AD|nr:hypothetical protein [Pseudomonas taiwanensis]MDT8924932.1 hypothetical protein [Pseudomonas taiwanensis]
MSKDRRNQNKLGLFYEEAQQALCELAERHGVEIPKGMATIEGQCLHWRLSVYADSGKQYWGELWRSKVELLGLPTHILPGDDVIDPDGESWQLLGLDPMSEQLPVRLKNPMGVDHFCSIGQAQMLQKI